jgi:hypothetical protein
MCGTGNFAGRISANDLQSLGEKGGDEEENLRVGDSNLVVRIEAQDFSLTTWGTKLRKGE